MRSVFSARSDPLLNIQFFRNWLVAQSVEGIELKFLISIGESNAHSLMFRRGFISSIRISIRKWKNSIESCCLAGPPNALPRTLESVCLPACIEFTYFYHDLAQ